MRRTRLSAVAALAGAIAFSGAQAAEAATAIFAGGCFWTVESDFDHAPGVISTTSGYIGGHVANPSYQQVVTETTGHREAVRVEYDPGVTSYEKLVDTFFHLIDPTDAGGQFCDRGESYTTAIYAGSQQEKMVAEQVKSQVAAALGRGVATKVAIAPTFYPAESFHQNFWRSDATFGNGQTRAQRYAAYRAGCGKNARVEAIWGGAAFRGLKGHA